LKLLDAAKDIIGTPDVCICLDSGALDYNTMWLTTSLRGVIIVDVTVSGGEIGYHSGEAGGIVPESFRVIRELLARIDDPLTGEVHKDFTCPIPDWKA